MTADGLCWEPASRHPDPNEPFVHAILDDVDTLADDEVIRRRQAGTRGLRRVSPFDPNRKPVPVATARGDQE